MIDGSDLARNDFARSAAAMWSRPLLVAITVGLVLVHLLLSGFLGLLVLPLTLFEIAFFATQRIWFLRAFRGKPFRADEIWPLSAAFFSRMLVAGIVTVGVASLPVMGAMLLRSLPRSSVPWLGNVQLTYLVVGALVALAADVVLTFVVPALAFTTASVREAFRHGVRMIGETWPRSAPYVLSPGIAALMPALWLPEAAMSLGVRTVLAVVGALLALWFKGAIAAFYLRLHPETPDDGAAYLAPPLA